MSFLSGLLHGASHLVGPGLLVVAVVAVVVLICYVIAIFRCDKGDIPDVTEAFGS